MRLLSLCCEAMMGLTMTHLISINSKVIQGLRNGKDTLIIREIPRVLGALCQELGAETEHPNQDAPSYLCCLGSYKGSRSSATGAETGLLISQQHRVQQHSDSTGNKGHLDEGEALRNPEKSSLSIMVRGSHA